MDLPLTPTMPTLWLVKNQNHFTEAELETIRRSRVDADQTLRHVCAEIKDKEEQLVRLDSELSVLENEKRDLVKKIKRCIRALSPLKKVPPEILRVIFKFCVPEKVVIAIPVEGHGGAYTISRVCSAWRSVALDTPELWTGISLKITNGNEKRIRGARQWLSRARALPRSISIEQDSLECDVWGNNVILNFVAHYPLRSLELTLPLKQLKQLKGLFDQSLSTLEVLRLKCYPADTGTLPLLFSPTDTLSQLNKLVLEGNWDLQNFTAVGSWSKIIHLDIKQEIPVSQCFVILQQCSQIEFCSLYVQDTGTVSTIPDISLPRVRTLWIFTGGPTFSLLVSKVTAPRLESLCFRNSRMPSDVNTAAFCHMIERCQGLKHLTAVYLGVTSVPLDPLTLLEMLPGLETMYISNGILDEDTINRISLGKVGPKLKRMTFKSRHDADEILRMVEVREQNASSDDGWLLARIPSFMEITFNCSPISSSLKDELMSRKEALENRAGNLTINLTFN